MAARAFFPDVAISPKIMPRHKDISKADRETPIVVKKPKIKVSLKCQTIIQASKENKLPIDLSFLNMVAPKKGQPTNFYLKLTYLIYQVKQT